MATPTFEAVATVLTQKFEVDALLIQPNAELSALGLDSLSLMEFVFAIEDHFALRIPEDRLDPRQTGLTLADLCSALDDALAQRSAATQA